MKTITPIILSAILAVMAGCQTAAPSAIEKKMYKEGFKEEILQELESIIKEPKGWDVKAFFRPVNDAWNRDHVAFCIDPFPADKERDICTVATKLFKGKSETIADWDYKKLLEVIVEQDEITEVGYGDESHLLDLQNTPMRGTWLILYHNEIPKYIIDLTTDKSAFIREEFPKDDGIIVIRLKMVNDKDKKDKLFDINTLIVKRGKKLNCLIEELWKKLNIVVFSEEPYNYDYYHFFFIPEKLKPNGGFYSINEFAIVRTEAKIRLLKEQAKKDKETLKKAEEDIKRAQKLIKLLSDPEIEIQREKELKEYHERLSKLQKKYGKYGRGEEK